jgi:hypothetical protein
MPAQSSAASKSQISNFAGVAPQTIIVISYVAFLRQILGCSKPVGRVLASAANCQLSLPTNSEEVRSQMPDTLALLDLRERNDDLKRRVGELRRFL